MTIEYSSQSLPFKTLSLFFSLMEELGVSGPNSESISGHRHEFAINLFKEFINNANDIELYAIIKAVIGNNIKGVGDNSL